MDYSGTLERPLKLGCPVFGGSSPLYSRLKGRNWAFPVLTCPGQDSAEDLPLAVEQGFLKYQPNVGAQYGLKAG